MYLLNKLKNWPQLGLILKRRHSSSKWAQIELNCSIRLGATVPCTSALCSWLFPSFYQRHRCRFEVPLNLRWWVGRWLFFSSVHFTCSLVLFTCSCDYCQRLAPWIVNVFLTFFVFSFRRVFLLLGEIKSKRLEIRKKNQKLERERILF